MWTHQQERKPCLHELVLRLLPAHPLTFSQGQLDPRLWAVMGTRTDSISQTQPCTLLPSFLKASPDSPMGPPTPVWMSCCSPVLPAAPDTWPFTDLAGSLLLGKASALQGAKPWPAVGWDGRMDGQIIQL